MTRDPFAHAQDLEVERAVISVLLDGRHKTAAGMLQEICPTKEYFWNRNHQMIIAVILSMLQLGVRIDRLGIEAELKRTSFQEFMGTKRVHAVDGLDPADSLMAAIGGDAISDIAVNALGSFSGFEANCRHLADLQTQRLLIQALAEASEQVGAPSGSKRAQELADKLIGRLSNLTAATDSAGDITDAMVVAMKRHAALQALGTARKSSWGLIALDKVIPLRAGRFIILAATPGNGKTSLAIQAAMASAQQLGTGAVGIISLEVPAEELGTLLLAREMGIPTRAIENGSMTEGQVAEAGEIIHKWGGTNIFLRSSSGRCTADDACAWIRQRFIRSGGTLHLIVIDYLQLLDGEGRQTDYERFSDATRALKRIALELRICLLVLSQLNREGSKADRGHDGKVKDNPEPRLSDLRGSGTIEQDADGVVFIHPPRESHTPDLPVMLRIAKNRGGAKPEPIDATFQRGNGQVFVLRMSPHRVVDPAPVDTSRAHHGHEPKASEDLYKQDDNAPF